MRIFTKTLCLVAALLLGGMNAWAGETVLEPVGGVTTVSTSSDVYVSGSSWTINQGGVSGGKIGRYAGPYCLVKFDASAIEGTITAATLTFDYESSAYNTSYNVYLLGATDWDPTSVVWSTLSDEAKVCKATIASGTWSTKNTKGTITYDILSSVSKSLMGMAICCNTGRAQVISNIKLTITATTSSVYTATFTETNNLTPTVTIYTDEERTSEIANGTLLDATTYYYTATLSGYVDYKGSFTVAGADPAVEFTMTAKDPFTYNVYAVDESTQKLQEDPIATVSGYIGEASDIAWSKFINIGNQWYVSTESSFYAAVSDAGEQNVTYKTDDVTSYFFECENTSYKSAGDNTKNVSASGGKGVLLAAGKAMTTTTKIAAGNYDISIYAYVRRSGEDALMLQYSTDNSEWTDIEELVFESSKAATLTSSAVTLSEDSYIRFLDTRNANSFHFYDYILIQDHEKTTAIQNVASQQAEKVIYNLQGQRIMKAQKGLNIINGKKVMVK